MAKFIEDVHHLLQRDMNYHVRPLYQCPNYNMATEVKGLDAYIKDLEEKFDEIQKKQEEAEAVIVKFKKPTH
jgi:hemerythrin-like domain-containing protein